MTARSVVAILGGRRSTTGNSRRGLVTLVMIAVGLKLVHWGYYVPEWNYRRSQGPWARAISPVGPPKWTLYTFHDWPADLAFFTKRPVRQLASPTILGYQPGPTSKFVLLQVRSSRTGRRRPRPITAGRQVSRSIGPRANRRPAGPPPPLGPNPSAELGGPDSSAQARPAASEPAISAMYRAIAASGIDVDIQLTAVIGVLDAPRRHFTCASVVSV